MKTAAAVLLVAEVLATERAGVRDGLALSVTGHENDRDVHLALSAGIQLRRPDPRGGAAAARPTG